MMDTGQIVMAVVCYLSIGSVAASPAYIFCEGGQFNPLALGVCVALLWPMAFAALVVWAICRTITDTVRWIKNARS